MWRRAARSMSVAGIASCPRSQSEVIRLTTAGGSEPCGSSVAGPGRTRRGSVAAVSRPSRPTQARARAAVAAHSPGPLSLQSSSQPAPAAASTPPSAPKVMSTAPVSAPPGRPSAGSAGHPAGRRCRPVVAADRTVPPSGDPPAAASGAVPGGPGPAAAGAPPARRCSPDVRPSPTGPRRRWPGSPVPAACPVGRSVGGRRSGRRDGGPQRRRAIVTLLVARASGGIGRRAGFRCQWP